MWAVTPFKEMYYSSRAIFPLIFSLLGIVVFILKKVGALDWMSFITPGLVWIHVLATIAYDTIWAVTSSRMYAYVVITHLNHMSHAGSSATLLLEAKKRSSTKHMFFFPLSDCIRVPFSSHILSCCV